MAGFPQIGEVFGGYRIDAELGRGGMGVVFRATQLGLQRPVALKVLDPRLAGDDEFVQRFQREAATLASMSSPHIIQVYDHGRVNDCLYIATQYVAGGDLRQLLDRSGALAPRLALDLCGQVLAALADAHARGVIHRDVKPSNILLTSSGARPFAYLCDFGIAQAHTSGLTHTGMVAGSWAYMAPERHQGSPATVQSDLYSAGCLLWATLTGHNPYPGTDVQMAMAHVNAPVPALAGSDALTAELNAMLRRSLAKDPADRYPSATDFLADVEALVEASPGAAHLVDDHTRIRAVADPEKVDATILRVHQPTPTPPTETVDATVLRVTPPASPPIAAPAVPPSPSAGRRPVLIAVGAAVAAVVVGAALFAVFGRGTATPAAGAAPAAAGQGDSSAASATAQRYVCWDGASQSTLTDCTLPSGVAGIHYVYPSMDADKTRCARVIAKDKTKTEFECTYGEREILRYCYWSSAARARAHYKDSYRDVKRRDLVLDGQTIGILYARETKKLGIYRMSGLWMDGRFSFSVEAPTKSEQEELAGKVLLRAYSDLRGYADGSQPQNGSVELP